LKKAEAVVTEEHEDAVRLLTFHKAKVRVPVVILADMVSLSRDVEARGGLSSEESILELHWTRT
jgi:hypothetical protein